MVDIGHFLDIDTDFRPVAHMTRKHVCLYHIATIIPGVLLITFSVAQRWP